MAETLSFTPVGASGRGVPWAALLVASLAAAGWFWPDATDVLLYERDRVLGGEWWRIWTAHFVHLGGGHLVWNLVVFVPAAVWAERLAPLRTRLFLAIAPGIIGAVLLALDSALTRYAGLSGVAAGAITLLAVLKLRAVGSDRWFWCGALLLLAVKIAAETASRQPLLTDLGADGAQPVPLAHLAGIVCAAIAGLAPRHTDGGAVEL